MDVERKTGSMDIIDYQHSDYQHYSFPTICESSETALSMVAQ